MAKVLDKITLDLNRDVVYGFEKHVIASRITSYVERALDGSVYPAVEVVKVGDIYWMNNVFNKDNQREDYDYGGHHRGVSSIISGHELECILVDGNIDTRIHKEGFRPIKDITIIGANEEIVLDFFKTVDSAILFRFLDMINPKF